MLTKILSVSGRPGLYKLISTGKNLNVVESLADGKRMPVYLQEKMVALSDVSIYTDNGDDTPLREVFAAIKEKESGQKVALGAKSPANEVFAYLAEVLPNYDKERVYASDAKKIIAWYNILAESGINFEADEQPAEEDADKNSQTEE